MAGHHWRIIRTRMLSNGIPNPMALTSLHALLDVVEDMVLHAVVSGCTQTEEAEAKRNTFLRSLYRPTGSVAKKLNGREVADIPSGFESPAEVEEAFNAFASAVAL